MSLNNGMLIFIRGGGNRDGTIRAGYCLWRIKMTERPTADDINN